uniref:NADH-ubiquinone oxidoreductase chain 2 n=1 Tax=Babylonia lutosa TaxID=128467 RepID=W5TZR7_BABLU|nr:NADH dehydrogenase subunit 2 [Babylonia lutosa]AHH30665.1 NADH dehydrogenase subunit 2 [Babylonia lutosa]
MFSSLPFGYMFLSVMGLGTLLSVSSIHWLGIWAGLEINLIGFLPMLVYQKSTAESESAVKYFIVQALGSSFLIFGSLMAFNMSFTWDVVSKMWLSGNFGLIMIMMGLYMKLGLFPFHYWLPGVMAGLPWNSCLLLATWQKLAPLFLVLSLLELNQSYLVGLVLCLVSAGSSLIGGLGGMNQTQVRALLAYSSIGHLGWMVFAAMQGEWVMKAYLGIYMLISLSMFLSLWYSDSGLMKHINNLKSNSPLQLSIMLLLLSLGGLTPLISICFKVTCHYKSEDKALVVFYFFVDFGFPHKVVLLLKFVFHYISIKAEKKWNGDNYVENKGVIIINILNVFGGSLVLVSGLLNFL